jgi:CheY-like chemotaxis protein
MQIDKSKIHAIIIDNVKSVRLVLTKALKEIEISNISTSDSILDAWTQIEDSLKTDKPINLVFCDWNMPAGDGIDL